MIDLGDGSGESAVYWAHKSVLTARSAMTIATSRLPLLPQSCTANSQQYMACRSAYLKTVISTAVGRSDNLEPEPEATQQVIGEDLADAKPRRGKPYRRRVPLLCFLAAAADRDEAQGFLSAGRFDQLQCCCSWVMTYFSLPYPSTSCSSWPLPVANESTASLFRCLWPWCVFHSNDTIVYPTEIVHQASSIARRSRPCSPSATPVRPPIYSASPTGIDILNFDNARRCGAGPHQRVQRGQAPVRRRRASDAGAQAGVRATHNPARS